MANSPATKLEPTTLGETSTADPAAILQPPAKEASAPATTQSIPAAMVQPPEGPVEGPVKEASTPATAQSAMVQPPAKRARATRTASAKQSPDARKCKYYIRYQGNGSKKWDGKEVVMTGEELESHGYTLPVPEGLEVKLLYPKGDTVEIWKGVVLPPPSTSKLKIQVNLAGIGINFPFLYVPCRC